MKKQSHLVVFVAMLFSFSFSAQAQVVTTDGFRAEYRHIHMHGCVLGIPATEVVWAGFEAVTTEGAKLVLGKISGSELGAELCVLPETSVSFRTRIVLRSGRVLTGERMTAQPLATPPAGYLPSYLPPCCRQAAHRVQYGYGVARL